MEKLHPKAIWLFFIQSLIGFGIFGFAISLFFLLPLLSVLQEAVVGEGIYIPWGWLILFFFFYIIFCYYWAKWNYNAWRYEFAENAVKIEKGVIWKKYISIPYERVQNVDIYRGILARILGLSDLHIQTAGYSGYGRHGRGTEGRLPGLDPQVAEQLREKLVRRVAGTKQGL